MKNEKLTETYLHRRSFLLELQRIANAGVYAKLLRCCVVTSADLGGTLSYAGDSQAATDAGSYDITPQGLTSGNYTLSFVDGVLTIEPRTNNQQAEITPPPPETGWFLRVANSSLNSSVDIVLNYDSSRISVTLDKMPSEQNNGIIVVSLPKGSSTAGQGFSFQLSKELSDFAAQNDGDVSAKMQSGKAIPGWLNFDRKTLIFTAKAVPDGAFPVEIVLTIGSQVRASQ